MILPLDLLIANQSNMYKLTCATIRRSFQITVAGDEELEKSQGKVVSLSIKQILTKKVEFRLES